MELIDLREIYQFYPIVKLWNDIQIANQAEINLIHLTSEPIKISEISEIFNVKKLKIINNYQPVNYDFQTKHANLYNSKISYQYSKLDSINAIKNYNLLESLPK